MPVTYETWLVLLSIVMAIQGAYVGLSLAVQIADVAGMRRRLLLAGATASLAVAIWTMHFVGMLAVQLPFQVDYLVLPTLLSFLVCAIVVGAAVYATSSGPLTLLRLTLSACLMGGGIFTMHYIGMSALDASAYMIHNRFYVAASMAIAIAASGLALWLAAGRGGRPPLIYPPPLSALPSRACTTPPWRGLPFIPTPQAYPGRLRCRPTSSPLSSPSSPFASREYFSCCCCRMRPARHRGLVWWRAVNRSGSPFRRSPRRHQQSPSWPRAQKCRSRIWTRDLCSARRRRRSSAARQASSHRARRQHAFSGSGRRRRRPCQRALHVHFRRQRQAVLSAGHRRCRVAAR